MPGAPATAAELASRVGVNSQGLRRLLRLAAFYGLVDEIPGGRFQLSAIGAQLRADAEGSVRAEAIMLGEQHYAAWGSLLYSVETGKPAFDHVFGAPFFDYMARNPDAQATFDAAMSAGVDMFLLRLADCFDYSKARLLVDVGGGNGSLSAIVLKHHPHMKAVIYDQAQVLEAADVYLTNAGVRDRCRLVPGNFFESVPEGGDVYLLSQIVHDWDDKHALLILTNCRASMEPAATMLLVEDVIPEHGTPSHAALMDVNMMVLLTGRERTKREFSSLLLAAGLRLQKVTPISKDESLIEARLV